MSNLTVLCEGPNGWTAFCMECIGPLGGCLWLTDEDTTKLNASRAARGHELGRHSDREPPQQTAAGPTARDMSKFVQAASRYGLTTEQINVLWHAAQTPHPKEPR